MTLFMQKLRDTKLIITVFVFGLTFLPGVVKATPIPAPAPNVNEIATYEDFFVLPSFFLRIDSVSGNVSLTEQVFIDLPDTDSSRRIFNIIGNISYFDASGAQLNSSEYRISQIFIADDFDFYPIPFYDLNFSSEISLTLTDDAFGDSVTYLAGESAKIFAIDTDEFQDYGLMLEITRVGFATSPLDFGSTVIYDDAEGRKTIPEPRTYFLLMLGLPLLFMRHPASSRKQ